MQSKVKVGPATVAGYGATLVGLVASVLVVVFGVGQDQAALVASSVWAIVAFSWTQWGRYTQARDAAKLGRSSWGAENAPSSGTNSVTTFQKGSVVGAHVTNHPGNDVMRDNALDPAAPAGPDRSFANPTLDDPEFGVPTAVEHSRLKG